MPSTFDNAAGLRVFPRAIPSPHRGSSSEQSNWSVWSQLPRPRNLFGELASIAELMAESAQPSARAAEHRWRMLVHMSQRTHAQYAADAADPYVRGFEVIYFRSEGCKNRWNQEPSGDRSVTSDPGPPDARGDAFAAFLRIPLSMRSLPHPGDRARIGFARHQSARRR